MFQRYLLITSILFVSGCATQNDSAVDSSKFYGLETVKFESTPAGANVSITDQKDAALALSCITPCELSLTTSTTLDVSVSKTGYVTQSRKNAFYVDPRVALLSRALLQAQTGKKVVGGIGHQTFKATLYTPEEEKQKAEEKRQKEQQIQSALADDTLDTCTSSSGSDRDALPLVRIPPIMPRNAEFSGHCNIIMNVNSSGQVTDAAAKSCTNDVFRESSLKTSLRWKFTPKMVNGTAVERCGVESRISFRLMGADGKIIHEPTSE